MTSEQAAQYVDNPLAFKCKVYQDTGGAIDYTPTVYKCASKDDFSSLTTIQTDSATSVSDVTDTALTIAVTDMGDCSNGIVVDVKAALTGSVSSKNFRIAEAMCQQAGTSTAFDEESYLEQVAALDKKLLVDDAITASASMDYAAIFSSNPEYKYFHAAFDGCGTSTTASISIRLSSDGSTFNSSAGDYRYGASSVRSGTASVAALQSNGSTILQIGGYSNTSTMTFDGSLLFVNPHSSGVNPVLYEVGQYEAAGDISTTRGRGFYDTAGAITGFQLRVSAGTLTATGRIKVWGSNTPF
jgi:hypothetical protein